jgi:cathepsin B
LKPEVSTPSCKTSCDSGSSYAGTYADDKKLHKFTSAYTVTNLPGDWGKIQQELMTNGPIEVAFYVFDDFFAYKSGVYSKTAGAVQMGGHGVKLIGWGVENGTKYWTCQNSWNTDWYVNETLLARFGSKH